jgi:hypothetical protein
MRLLRPALLALLCVLSSVAQAEPRDVLRDCQALLARVAQAAPADKPNEADVTRCRQVVRDWTLRDSRMLVDEDGKKLR